MNPFGVVLLVVAAWLMVAVGAAVVFGAVVTTAERHRPRVISRVRRRAADALERVATLATGSIPMIRQVSMATGAITVIRD